MDINNPKFWWNARWSGFECNDATRAAAVAIAESQWQILPSFTPDFIRLMVIRVQAGWTLAEPDPILWRNLALVAAEEIEWDKLVAAVLAARATR